jgi:hypothetical protein
MVAPRAVKLSSVSSSMGAEEKIIPTKANVHRAAIGSAKKLTIGNITA